jgi:hypothetical protein
LLFCYFLQAFDALRHAPDPHWAQLVEMSLEKITEEHYELAKTWFFLDHDPGDISMPE